MGDATITTSNTERNEDYTGSVCLLHGLTAKFPRYQEILVDIEDFAWLATQEWRLANVSAGKEVTRVWRKDKKYLAVLLMKPGPGEKVDHRNHRPLDNRRNNLRNCRHRQNNINSIRQKNGSSRYKGVYRFRAKWYAQAGSRGKRVFLGSFASEIDAARAYNDFAKREYGEFACLNPV